MTRNRLVQLVAILAAIGCVVATSWVTPHIELQRKELQLSTSTDLKEDLPANVAIATAALGSFRGLAVDVMWYRLEMLKRDGKFHEANTLSQWITTLQPRFQQVWSFMAWNMAYNISVATYTPDERMDWVNKGIELLREKGIPYNPNAIRLYRELGWIFFHKVGQYSDDQHWYYKRRLAQEWQELLGTLAEGGTAQQAVDAFRPVADAYDKYVNQQRPTREALQLLDTLIKEQQLVNAELATQLEELSAAPLFVFDVKARRLRDKLAANLPSVARRLDAIIELTQGQLQRGQYAPEQLLAQDDPAAAAVIQQLTAMGLPPDEQTMRHLGRIRMILDSPDARTFGVLEASPNDPIDRQLVAMFSDEASRGAIDRVLPFLRAKVLTNRYHMDPNWMLHLMEEYGPVDWRNPAAHSLYWSSLGVRMAMHLRNKKDVDLLNTSRQVIHSLQTLRDYGRTTYDPVSGYIDQLPNVAFIPAYEKAVLEAGEEVAKEEWGSGTADTFDAGYENFLIKAVVYIYLYGDEKLARDYYDKLRTKFGDKDHNLRTGRYLLPLDMFVTRELTEDMDMMTVARQAIDAFLQAGIREGLANNLLDIYERRRAIAKVFHDQFQKKAIANPTAVQDRMALLPFEKLEQETYIAYMKNTVNPLLVRVRIWRNSPPYLRDGTYARLQTDLGKQCEEAGIDFARAFPAPPGFTPTDKPTTDETAEEVTKPAEGVQVERQ